MKHLSRFLSAVISCAIAGSGIIPASVTAASDAVTDDTSSPIVYDTTETEESKAPEAEVSSTKTPAVTTVAVQAEPSAVTTTEVPYNVFDIYNAHQGFIAQTTTVEPAPVISLDRESFGIDVSQWQADIDWKAVKDSGVDFAIIRAGYGKMSYQEDPKFDTNMQQAQAQGIDCGAYWYSYATTVEDAYTEAMTCYEVIKDYDFTYPVYFDIEDSCQSRLTTAEVSAIIETFCSTLQDKGYYVGIYSYANFLTTRVFENVLDKYDVWVAHFNVDKPAYSRDYKMWQYTSTGHINGINGSVDLDHCYYNYPYVISPDTYVEPQTSALLGGAAVTNTTTTTAAVSTTQYIKHGVDVSEWNGNIDWSGVKGADFAVIRAGYGRYAFQKDKCFDQNLAGVKAAGIPCGVYWYSYADSPEDAVLEAETCYSIIKDYQFEYPVFYNIEDPMYANYTREQITAITDAFCSTMQSKGYYVSIQTYANFLKNNLDSSVLTKFDVWVAHFGVSSPAYSGTYGMWKYTNSASVYGISGSVNASYSYLDYPTIMKEKHLNGF
ncbi:MAG: glycoside hydrolase family 25 protein [Ruminococcus sp.]|nr:glycoside hydrolase family 25 protein [Ruminococcus sp.]